MVHLCNKDNVQRTQLRIIPPLGNSECFEIRQGLEEGSILSPAIFNVVVVGMNRVVKDIVKERQKDEFCR